LRPVRIIFGFGPGSSGDVMSRVLAHGMSHDLGRPVIVEGKPGANGQLGAAQVARAPADGYTLFLASVSNATNLAITPEVQPILRNAGIDPLGGSPEDFAQLIRSEVEKWTKVATAAGLRK
jgi:tripartite-type tricarboxylate transporter receptor subunit TctC